MSEAENNNILLIQDIFLNIAAFVSLNQLSLLQKTCKIFNSWLSATPNHAWTKRIRMTYPNQFESILKQDMQTQIKKLKKFDSLIDSGWSIACYHFDTLTRCFLPAMTVGDKGKLVQPDGGRIQVLTGGFQLTEKRAAELLVKHNNDINRCIDEITRPGAQEVATGNIFQISWAKHLFIVYYGNKVFLFNSLLCSLIDQIEISEWTTVFTILFDHQSHKVGFVDIVTGQLKIYSLCDRTFNFESHFESKYVKSMYERRTKPHPVSHANSRAEVMLPQIYGDNLIIETYSSLKWLSMKSHSFVKTVQLPSLQDPPKEEENFTRADGLFIEPSVIKPVLYISRDVFEYDLYQILEVDCTLSSPDPVKLLFTEDLLELENCGDGIQKIILVENENGRSLQIYKSACDHAVDVFDLDEDYFVLFTLYFKGEKIGHNPGTAYYIQEREASLYSEEFEGATISIMNGEDSSTHWSKTYPANIFTEFSMWLDDDTAAIQSRPYSYESILADAKIDFISIAKKGLLGSINDRMIAVHKVGHKIVAFNTGGEVYIITPEPRSTDIIDEEDEATTPKETKKRKADEITQDEAAEETSEPQPKKSKIGHFVAKVLNYFRK